MKKATTRRHQTAVTIDWNTTLKMQLAAILEAKLGPTFGPENDDEPGCYARPSFPCEDVDEDEDEDDSFSLRLVSPIMQQKTFGDDTGWSLIKDQVRPSFPDDDGNGRTTRLIPLAGPEGNDSGWDAPIFGDEGSHDWDAPMKCLSIRLGLEDEEDAAIKARVTFDPEGDEDDEDGSFLFARLPHLGDEDDRGGTGWSVDCAARLLRKRNALRIRFGDEDCRGGGWSTLALYQPQEEPYHPSIQSGNFSQSRATRSTRVAVLAAPRFGRDDDEAAPRFGKDDDED